MFKSDSDLIKLPEKGFVFWPVGNGDSTTIVVDEKNVIQIDLNNLQSSEEEGNTHIPVIDKLIEVLPKINDKPYLSLFILTHPDEDHCRGFKELLKQVDIGEIWFTPRVFREYKKDLCDDAKAFRKEAERRIQETIENDGNVDFGDYVRIIGYDDILDEEEFDGFPEERLTIPGNEVSTVTGKDLSSTFRAFIHAPFKDDSAGDRNDTSLAMQIQLYHEDITASALFFGDLSYPVMKRIFEISNEEDLEWDIFLAPHHCSKSVMYWKDEDEEEESLRQDILDMIEASAEEGGYLIASCYSDFSDEERAKPPHKKAKKRYEEIIEAGHFICTQDYPDDKNPYPIVFSINDEEFGFDDKRKIISGPEGLEGIANARGKEKPPTVLTGFGVKK